MKKITAIYAFNNDNAKRFVLKNGYQLTWASTLMKYDGDKFEEPDLPVRQYRDEDFDEAFRLSAEAFHRMRVGTGCFPDSVVAAPRKDTRERWLRWAKEKYVIEMDGEIVGYANLDEEELSSVSVKISHQGKGLGKQFVKYLTNRLIDKAIDEPVLWCVEGNENARHIYESLGYKEVFTQRFAEKNLS
ncbi:MAG: GNAT family N-acetyltransferase [Bacilli bacterium]|nr:GNAT family N-acetyltransferase [Bacilli bacterium]